MFFIYLYLFTYKIYPYIKFYIYVLYSAHFPWYSFAENSQFSYLERMPRIKKDDIYSGQGIVNMEIFSVLKFKNRSSIKLWPSK